MMTVTENYFIRETGTTRFVKFRPNDPAKPFGVGTYVVAEGIKGAAIFDRLHAWQFVRGLPDNDLEIVSVKEFFDNHFKNN